MWSKEGTLIIDGAQDKDSDWIEYQIFLNADSVRLKYFDFKRINRLDGN